jgi:cell division protein FtsB
MDEPLVVRRPIGPPPLALRLAAVLAVPLLLYVLVATGQKALDNYRLNQEADALRAQVVALRGDNLALQAAIEQSRTDAAIETIAREKLNLIKPGDRPVVLLGSGTGSPTASTAAASATPTPTPPPSPIWRQWWAYFFG